MSPPIDLHAEVHDRLRSAGLCTLAVLPCWHSKHVTVAHYGGTLCHTVLWCRSTVTDDYLCVV